jgi:hypothetical protein
MKKVWWLPLLVIGCGGRPAALDRVFHSREAVGLDSSVAVLDPSLDRVLMLSSPSPFELSTVALPVGLNVATTKASPDGKQLFVLSKGIHDRRETTDQGPRLTVIESEPSPRVSRTYAFSDPLSGLVLDEQMEWAIAYMTPADGRAVRNPNEISLIDLTNQDPNAAPIDITVQSGGSSPQGFLFTDRLLLPNGEEHRFLVVLTEHDVVLLDLADAANAESSQIRIEMPRTEQDAAGRPAQVVFHSAFRDDAFPEKDVESELAVRMGNDSNVYLLSFADAPESYSLRPNLVDVGGIPSTIEFVQTNAGVRLLALVGGKGALVDPLTSNAVEVNLKTAYKRITRVTEELAGAEGGGDVALLWSDQASEVGLWNLGASTTTSRGLDTLDVGVTVSQVIDVPGTAYPTYKILESQQGDFYVLDVKTHDATPMDTNGRNFTVTAAPDGERLWAFLPGGTDFASIDLQNRHAASLSAERPITGLFDVTQAAGSGRTAIVLHQSDGDLGVTVLNALEPDSARTRFYSGIAFEGITP